MTKKDKEQVRKLFESTKSIDYICMKCPNLEVEEIIGYLLKNGIICEKPRKICLAGEITYAVSDKDLLEDIKQSLAENLSDRSICAKYHIGRSRLVKMKKKYGLIKGQDTKKEGSAKQKEYDINSTQPVITSQLLALVQPLLRERLLFSQIASNLSLDISTLFALQQLLQLTKVPKGRTSKADEPPTLEEKIVYANKTYGKGKWVFLTKEDFKSYMYQKVLV